MNELTTKRILPIRSSLVPGESLSSYAERFAGFLEVPLGTLLARTGLATNESCRSITTLYGVVLSPEQVRSFERVARLPRGTVSDMLLSRYDGVCCDLSRLDPNDTRSVRLRSSSQWIYWTGSHMCPLCVMETGGAWQLKWKLPWCFSCLEHQSLLVDTCPGCQERSGRGFVTAMRPNLPSRVPTPLECQNPGFGELEQGRRSCCGYPLETIKLRSLAAWPSLLEAQMRLQAALEGEVPNLATEESSPWMYFRDLTTLCILILSWGDVEDLGDIPPFVQEAFSVYAEKRDEVRAAGNKRVPKALELDRLPRHHFAPTNAALMASIVPVATQILTVPSEEDLTASLEPFVEKIWRHNSVQAFPARRASVALRQALDRCWKRHQRFSRRLGMSGPEKKLRNLMHATLTPNDVPQMLWEEVFRESFADLFAKLDEVKSRWFCSAVLVRLSGDYDWAEAADLLGIPSHMFVHAAKKRMRHLNSTDRVGLFDERIHMVAQKLANSSSKVDYGRRRRLLADFEEIDRAYWDEHCDSSLPKRPIRDIQRRIFGAVWSWAHVTEGYYLLSPWFREHNDELWRRRYDRFLTYSLDAVRTPLIAFARLKLRKAFND